MKNKVIISYLNKRKIHHSSLTELDIFIPSSNLSIEEVNIKLNSAIGGRDENYFYKRMQSYHKKGVDYCLLWDFEFNRWNIIESLLNDYLGLTKDKITAKKCIARKLSTKEEKDFFNNNHINHYEKSSIAYGLFYNEDLVSAMSFKTSATDVKLIRYCDKLNTKVIGGFEKLFLSKPEYLPVYITQERRLPLGCLGKNNRFIQLGFNKLKITRPNEHFINDNYTGFVRTKKKDSIWDCGNTIWEYENVNY